MSEPKYLLYPAEGDFDEDEGMTEAELAAMLVKSTTGYSLEALIECAEAMPEVLRISDRKHDAWDRAKAALAKLEDQSK